MNAKWIFKSLTLSLALGLTVYSMYLLNSRHVPDFLSSLGLGEKTSSLSWCKERVLSVEGLDESHPWKLFEENNTWWITKGSAPPQSVDYLAIEKWFAHYCTLNVHQLHSEKIFDLPLSHLAKFTFNDSSFATLHSRGGNTYQLNQVVFESSTMTEAWLELRKLLTMNQ